MSAQSSKKGRHASRKQMIACNDRLREVLTMTAGGLCEYKDNFSDLLIGEELGISESSVRGVRLEMFGKLRTSTGPTNGQLELETVSNRQDIDVLIDRLNRLIANLQMNHVADVKHLAIVK